MAVEGTPGQGTEAAPGAARTSPSGWRGALLRIPLFWKLYGAQVVVLTLVLAVSVKVLPGQDPGAGLLLVVVLTFSLSAALSAWVLRMALRPVQDLTDTARRVTQGDWRVRAPRSPFADERMERLGQVLNEMLDAVALAHRSQRDLSRRVLESEERERERIAHELYAGTAQTLAGLLVRLRILSRQVDPEVDRSGIEEITAELRTALQEIRSVARRLRPPELDELGVRSALEAHARTLTEGSDVQVRFTGDVPEERLDSDARLGLFRITQEAITNAVEHGRPDRIDIAFHPTANGLRVEVVDDGSGFEVPAGGRLADFANLGLVGMRERAEYAQGNLMISSTPGVGTRVSLLLPLQRASLPAAAAGNGAASEASHGLGLS
jgi:two-component system sensor histidine kinase UhpB